MNLDAAQLKKKTFFLEHFRSAFHGMTEPFVRTFFLLIAIQVFSAGELWQALIAGSMGVGLLISPVTVTLARHLDVPVTRISGSLIGLGGLILCLGSYLQGFTAYVMMSLPAVIIPGACLPLFTELYQQNYPDEERGALFGRTQRVLVAAAVLFAWLCGFSLELDLNSWSLWVRFFGVGMAAGGLVLLIYTSQPLGREKQKPKGIPLFRSLRWVREDASYRWLIMIYMVMGFGNIMMLPLRVIILADPQYGFNKSPEFIAIVTAVIPPIMLFLFTPLWGRLFDRMNFYLLRTIINVFLLISILVFFLPGTTWGFVTGAILLGLGFSGGNIAWSLWVTKLAPPDRVADYMSGHTFFTGLRAVVAPLISVPLATVLPMPWLVGISCSMILISILMLGPEITTWRVRTKAKPLNSNIAE
jgi:MFS family permease